MAAARNGLRGGGSAAALAGEAILLEIGAECEIVDLLQRGRAVDAGEAAAASGLPESVVAKYLRALVCAGLVKTTGGPGLPERFEATPRLHDAVHEAGYLAWGLRACEPLVTHALEFARNPEKAREAYPRDGRLVARTSRWMGEKAFYPQSEKAILTLRPKFLVDLGAGSAGLLIRCLSQLPGATGVAVDMSARACAGARSAAERAGLADRLNVVERTIESLADDSALLEGADVIHAGWVFHDLLPEQENTLDRLLAVCRAKASTGTLVIVEGVPYAEAEWERAFSAAFSFLHDAFMGRRLLSESEWCQKLYRAGFRRLEVTPLGIPGGRLFQAHM